jgi:drug/metabolite transporter (DMT)-like permease
VKKAARVEAPPTQHITAAALVPVAVLALVWGCNWPIMKMGVSEFAPLTFRALTLPVAALGLLAAAKLSGDSIRVPRALWARVVLLGICNISVWNGLLLFGVQQLPAGRSAILAFTTPIWTVLFSLFLLHEPLSKRKVVGLTLGMFGLALLLGDDIRHLQRTPTAALFILGASVAWAFGTVLLRKWKVPMPQNALTGWMMLVGWAPLAVLAPFFDAGPLSAPSPAGLFALVYNMFLAGTLAHWAWYTLARTLPVAVSSMSSLPVPIVGVFSGMLLLGERPGSGEWVALALVLAAMFAVLWVPKPVATPSAPAAPDN